MNPPFTVAEVRPRLAAWLGAAAVGLVIIAIAAVIALNKMTEPGDPNKIVAGVSISNIYVGGLTRDEAKTKIAPFLNDYTARSVVLAFKDKTWKPSMTDLGIVIDLEGSLDDALAAGRGGNFLTRMSTAAINVPLEVRIDDTKLNGYLDQVASSIGRGVVEPTVKLDGTNFVTTPGNDGYSVDTDATYQAIRKVLESFTATDDNVLVVRTQSQTIAQTEIDAVKAKIAPIFSTPFTVKYADKTWTLDQNQLAKLVTVNVNNDPKANSHVSYNFDPTPLRDWIGARAKEINQEAKNAVIGWSGKVVARAPSKDGLALNTDKSYELITKNIVTADNRSADLQVDVTHPAIDGNNLDTLGIKEMVSEGVSSFGGSAGYRAHNIQTGLGYLNETLVPPNTLFSFNAAVGDINATRGYQEGYSIVGDETVKDWGGGICQVSTTTFRAAFWGGFPIEERNAHAYRVGWYEEMDEPVGFDAAIYQPSLDFKFKNDSQYYLLIVSYVSNGRAYVDFYSTSRGYKVEMTKGSGAIANSSTNPPKDSYRLDPKLTTGQITQTDSARKGLSARIGRVVSDKNGNVVSQGTFYSEYQAWPNIFHYGPGTRGIPGVAEPSPTAAPTKAPAADPTKAPAAQPTKAPQPTPVPTKAPAAQPTAVPTKKP